MGVFFAIIFLLYFGYHCGALFWKQQDVASQATYGITVLITCYIILLSILYYLHAYTSFATAALIIVTPIALFIGYKVSATQLPQFKPPFISSRHVGISTLILIVISLFLYASMFAKLLSVQTDTSITSPWNLLSQIFFIQYLLATFVLIALSTQAKFSKFISAILLSLHLFLSFSVALIIYKLGFGFDPFIHESTIRHIAENGFILPKQPYYVGYYMLILFLHDITHVSISFLNTAIIPISASILLTTFSLLLYPTKNKLHVGILAALSFLIIPYSGFVMSTPQALANLFAILVIIQLFHNNASNLQNNLLPFLMSIATLFIHPLTGAPLFLFTLLFVIWMHSRQALQKNLEPIINSIFFLTGLLTVPILFLIQNWQSGSLIPFTDIIQPSNISVFIPSLSTPHFYKALPDMVYAFGMNQILIVTMLSILGIYFSYKQATASHRWHFVAMAIGLFMSAPLINLITLHPDVIAYEQNSFAARISVLGLYFLIPFLLLFILYFIEYFHSHKNPLTRLAPIVIITALVTISFYFAYPRDNTYEIGRFHSLSASDKKAVNWIENETQSPYVVLSNQMMSAAALQQFGFDRYSNGIYFYAIPTGGQLYEQYLAMVYQEPSRETMKKAADLYGASSAYFAIHDYWLDADTITKKLETISDSQKTIDNGAIRIFGFDFSND